MKKRAKKKASDFRRSTRKGPESGIQASIRDYIQKLGYWCERHNVHEGFMRNGGYIKCGQKGESDLVAFIRQPDGKSHRVLRIETKAPKGVQSPEQKMFAELARMDGQEYIVARSIDDVEAKLKAMGSIR